MNKRVKQTLDDLSVDYRVYRHQDLKVPIRNPNDFAVALGYDAHRITKTLLVRATDRMLFGLVVLSSNQRVDMVGVAALLGVKRVKMASREELEETLGFPPTGVAPVGAGDFPVLLDCGLLDFRSVLIGSGEIGIEIELSPADLVRASKGTIHSLKAESQ